MRPRLGFFGAVVVEESCQPGEVPSLSRSVDTVSDATQSGTLETIMGAVDGRRAGIASRQNKKLTSAPDHVALVCATLRDRDRIAAYRAGSATEPWV